MTFEPFAFPMAGSKHDLGHQPNDKVLIALRDALIPLVARAPVPPIAFQPGQLELIRGPIGLPGLVPPVLAGTGPAA
jgi:hypothetical protein